MDLIRVAKEKGTYTELSEKKTAAHKSYSLAKIKEKGAVLIYEKK